MYFVNFHQWKYPMDSRCVCWISVSCVNHDHVKWISWLCSQQSWLPHRETTGSFTSLSGLTASLGGSFHIEPCERFHYSRNYGAFSENLRNQLACHQAMCHKFISKKLMSVGEKLKSIILHSQFGHNIYNIKTWITNTNAKGKKVFTDWVITSKTF